MRIPAHLAAFDGDPSDYVWYPNEETPAEPVPAPVTADQPAKPAPVKTEFYCRDANGQLVEAGEFFRRKTDAMLADPNWQEKLAEENRVRKEARREARRLARRKDKAA